MNGETCEREIACYAGRSRSGHRATSTAEERRLHQTAAEMVDHGTAVQAKWAAQHFADLSEHGPSPALVARTRSLDLELCLSCLLCRTPSARIMRVVQSLNDVAQRVRCRTVVGRSSATKFGSPWTGVDSFYIQCRSGVDDGVLAGITRNLPDDGAHHPEEFAGEEHHKSTTD